MPSGDVETYWENGQWHLRIEGTNDSFRSCDTKAEAIEIGGHWARHLKVEHVIRSEDGTVSEHTDANQGDAVSLAGD